MVQANTEESLRRQESFWQYKLKSFFPDGPNESAVPGSYAIEFHLGVWALYCKIYNLEQT